MKSMRAKLVLLIGAILSVLTIVFKENIGNVAFYIFMVFAIIILIMACILEKVDRNK